MRASHSDAYLPAVRTLSAAPVLRLPTPRTSRQFDSFIGERYADRPIPSGGYWDYCTKGIGMPSTGKRQSSGNASAGAATLASPARIFAGLMAVAFALLWVTPQDARPLQTGVRWALNPGVQVVEWTERQTNKLVQYTRRELPASDTLGRKRPNPSEALR